MTHTKLTVYEKKEPSKIRTILVIYRVCKAHRIEIGNDTWMFLGLKSSHYGTCGYSLDLIMLMDGITQAEFARDPACVVILPSLKKDGTIMEAG